MSEQALAIKIPAYKLKIKCVCEREDFSFNRADTSRDEHTYDLKPQKIFFEKLEVEILDLLYENNVFYGLELEIKNPGWNSSLKTARRETLLLGKEVHAGYGSGNDFFDVRYSFTSTIISEASLIRSKQA